MAKYKILFEGEEEDDVFDTYEEAEEHALYLVSCYHTGGEILEMSNLQMAQTNGRFCGAKRPQGASLWPRGAAERPCLFDL